MAVEENLIDLDFDVVETKNPEDDCLKQLAAFERSDAKRNQMILNLHGENQKLKEALEQRISDSAEKLNDRLTLNHTQQSLRSHNHVTVLIDGNNFNFRKDLLRKGAIGGDEAAYYLYNEVQEHIKQYGGAKDWKIVVQIYMDIDGILQKLHASGLTCDQSLLRDFSRGFSRHQSLFDIVDVGHGGEQVNIKIEGVFDLAIHSVQCQHILLGHCHEQHLAKLLKPYGESILDSYRITLLKKSATVSCNLPGPFPSVQFPSVFGPIEPSSQSHDQFPVLVDFSRGSLEVPTESNDLSGSTVLTEDSDEFAFPNSKGSHVSTPSIESAKSSGHHQSSSGDLDPPSSYPNPPPAWDPNKRLVLLNVNHERVDTYLGKVDAKASERVAKRNKEKRLCNDFHLNQKCWSSECPYAHEPHLDPKELVVLRYWARRIPCDRKSACRNIDCWYGHNCGFDKYCNLSVSCRFRDVHHVDKRAVTVWRPGLG